MRYTYDQMTSLWEESSANNASHLIDKYFRNGRGIPIKDLPPSIAYDPSMAYYNNKKFIGRYPTMIAKVTDCKGEIVNIQRTHLKNDLSSKLLEEKAEKILSKYLEHGGSVHLAPSGTMMAVGEGIETCLAFQVATGIHTWAALNTGNLVQVILPPLPLAETVVIVVDNDPRPSSGSSSPGMLAALKLALRLQREGREVRLCLPTIEGQLKVDMNDLIRLGVPQ